jgi:hypothetical protein
VSVAVIIGWLEGLAGRLQELLAAQRIQGLDEVAYGLVGLLALWVSAIAITSIRDACQTRQSPWAGNLRSPSGSRL